MTENEINKDEADGVHVSIIMATYNSERYILSALQSIVEQGIDNLEVVVADGGSTDRTVELIKGENIKRIKIISEPDRGIGDAWNKGLKLSSGSIIGILNSDDYYAKETLKNVLPYFDGQEEPLIGFGDLILIDSQTQVSRRVIGRKRGKFALLNGFGFGHPTVFFNRKALDKIGYFNPRISVAVDTDWLLRAVSIGIEFKKVSSLVYMRTGGISHANKHTGMGEYADALVRNGYSEFQMLMFFMLRFLGKVRKFFYLKKFNE
jgi:glycosyltransferase involved in cell wall biosynthesis